MIVTGVASGESCLDADSTEDAFGAAAASAGLVTGMALTAEAVTLAVAFGWGRAAGSFFAVGFAAICAGAASAIGSAAIREGAASVNGSAAIRDGAASTVGSRAIWDDDSCDAIIIAAPSPASTKPKTPMAVTRAERGDFFFELMDVLLAGSPLAPWRMQSKGIALLTRAATVCN